MTSVALLLKDIPRLFLSYHNLRSEMYKKNYNVFWKPYDLDSLCPGEVGVLIGSY